MISHASFAISMHKFVVAILHSFPAGYLEAWLTAERIVDYHNNTRTYFLQSLADNLTEPIQWLEEQDAWARQQVWSNFDISKCENKDQVIIQALIHTSIKMLWERVVK